jgi:chaperone LolA
MYTLRKHFIYLLVWCCTCLPLCAGAITGSEVITKMRERFADHKNFSAAFERQIYLAVLDQEFSARGRIVTRKPRQFRIEVGNDILIVADGKSIWLYNRQNEQAIVSTYEGELKTPWEILIEYSDAYAPLAVEEVDLDGRSCYLLSLVPRVPKAQVSLLKIWVDRKKWYLRRLEEFKNNEDRTTYVLKDHRTNKKLGDDLFRLELPEGIDVIDRRIAEPANGG